MPDAASVASDLDSEGVNGGIAYEHLGLHIGHDDAYTNDRAHSISRVDPGFNRIGQNRN